MATKVTTTTVLTTLSTTTTTTSTGNDYYPAGPPDLVASPIFNPYFYLNNNPVLVQAGVTSPSQARDHWLSEGMQGGLQGCGSFHSRQYLQRYPYLAEQFGQNYTAAAEHYLTEGQRAGLLGYLDGGFEGRYTISDVTGQLFISASTRMGGAVDSVVFDNTEFINAYDHGRELQVAMTIPPNGECFNPTEGGSRNDNRTAQSTTQIQSITAQNGMLNTTVLPAFWIRSGEKETKNSGDNCKVGSPAINTKNVYSLPISKNITMGCPGVGPEEPCFTYSLSVMVGGKIPNYTLLRVEGPTGYHTQEFNTTRSLNTVTGELVDFDETKPLVFSTWCLQHAFGIWAPPGQDSDYPPSYGYVFHLGDRPFPDATVKWHVIWLQNAFRQDELPVTLEYTVYICVGTQVNAAECTMKLIEHYYETH